jgi:branched-chain amino acid transport system substrate-binding protein
MAGSNVAVRRCGRCFVASLCVLFAVAVTPAFAQVTIGAVAPLTGARAQLGRYYRQGVELAVAEINAAGGVLDKPLSVDFEDDQGDNPNAAMNAVNRLMQVAKVPVFLGPHYSVAQMATQKAYCNGTVISVTGASGPPVTHSGCHDVIRVRADDDIQARSLVAYLHKVLKTDKIGILYVNDDYGRAGAQRVAAALGTERLKPVAMESHNAGDQDFSAQLGRLNSAGADVVVLWTHETEAALIVRQARQMGASFRFAGAALSQPTFLRLTGSASEGVISVDDFIATNPAPSVQAFVRKYRAKYGADPEIWAAAYYDAAHLAALAINQAGSTNIDKVRGAFDSVHYTGALGTYHCDANGDCNHQSLITEIKGGKPTLVGTQTF